MIGRGLRRIWPCVVLFCATVGLLGCKGGEPPERVQRAPCAIRPATITPPVLVRGEPATLKSTGFECDYEPPASSRAIRFTITGVGMGGADRLGETTVDSSGAYEFHFVVPHEPKPGRGEITINGSTLLSPPCDRPDGDSHCQPIGAFDVSIE